MKFLSEEDKELWENYKLNLNKLRIVINPNDLVNIVKKEKIKNIPNQGNTFNRFVKLLEKGKIEPDGVIDLHGLNLNNAKKNLDRYIFNAYNNYKRNILIITGIGLNKTGLLKKEVPIWLKENDISKLIINCQTAPNSFGGEGALIVRIRNKYKN
ncbi:Smr/MutS family protein [Alphaproteobacteria bacterium]|nr:Smr/MutS family protein [Alphaproteobacteria bacterium]